MKKSKTRGYKKHFLEVFIEVFILIFLIPLFFTLSIFLGVFYILAVFTTFYHGTLFKDEGIVRIVVIGSILTYFAGKILLFSYDNTNGIVFVLLLLLSLYVWYVGYRIKRQNSLFNPLTKVL
jgi:hypothetical protein